MNSPLAEFLDKIKEMYEGSGIPTMYRIVKLSTCDTEVVYNYDDLCVKMFDLDVSGWEISEEIDGVAQTSIIGQLMEAEVGIGISSPFPRRF